MALLGTTALSRAHEHCDVSNLSIAEGLSNDFVLDMATDGYGFVWAGTKNGLNKITGYGVLKYTDKNSRLVNNYINALCFEKASNKMWVGTLNGISIVDCATGQMTTLDKTKGLAQNAIMDIKPAANGGLWILYMNNGVQYYDVAHKRLRPQTRSTLSKLSLTAHCCTDNGAGQLYIGHNGFGMSIVDLRSHNVERFRHKKGDKESLPSDNVREIVCDQAGNVWVGTDNGLAIFNPLSRKFHKIESPLLGDNIYSLSATADGRILAACNLDGISVIDTRDAEHGNLSPTSISKLEIGNAACNAARAVLKDAYGNVWIGSYGTGITFVNLRPTVFDVLPAIIDGKGNTSRVYGITACRDGGLWLGSDNGLSLYRDSKVVGHWQFADVLHRASAFVYVMHEDHEGNVWIGLDDEGVIVFDSHKRSFRRIDIPARKLDIHAFMEMPGGGMMIGSEVGAYLYKDGKVSFLRHLTAQLASPTIYGLVTDHLGRLWIGTDGGGVTILTKTGKRVAVLKEGKGLPSSRVSQLFMAKDKSVWIATDKGVCHVPDVAKPHDIEFFGNAQGLTDSYVMAVTQDIYGQIWVSTFTNIACLDMASRTFAVYDFNVGVTAGGFVEGSAALTTDGYVYFGSPKGVCSVNTQCLRMQRKASRVYVVGCETVASDTRHLVPLFPEDGVYRLPHDASTIRVAFSVADYGERGKVEYAYCMEGLDDKWVFTDGDEEVAFRNLSPGKYTFKVKANYIGGKPDDGNVTKIEIVVSPPWWATWWMMMVYVVAIAAIAFEIARIYKRRLKLVNALRLRDATLAMERENRQKDKEMGENRLRFFTNIAHELRTPLTLVIGPVDDLRNSADMPKAYKQKLGIIYQNAVRLLGQINRLMEFRKTETGNYTLCVSKDDICATVRNVGLRFVESQANSKVKLSIKVPKECINIYFDKEAIAHIIENLMSNAFKYTPAGGQVCLALTADSSYVNVSVADNGHGISKEALPHIFDRYYQENGKHQASGTGIGLALVKSLVKLHEGTVDVESELGKGTTFVVRLSRANIYPEAMHKTDETEKHDTPTVSLDSEPSDEEHENGEKASLLVVEDNEDIRNYIVDELGDSFRVLAAKNGLEAWNIIQGSVPDIVVSDIMMPEMDGMELCRRMKGDINTSHVPVILLTAKDTIDDKEEGYRCGADSYITKPFSAKMLKARIENLQESRRRMVRNIVAGNIAIANNGTRQEKNTTTEKEDNLTDIDRKFISDFTRLATENMSDSELDMAFFTEHLNMSYSSFYRKVKALCGVTPVDFLRQIRLKHSAELLGTGNHNVTEVAQMCGFDNMGHFRKCFKAEYGVAPSEYMRKNRN